MTDIHAALAAHLGLSVTVDDEWDTGPSAEDFAISSVDTLVPLFGPRKLGSALLEVQASTRRMAQLAYYDAYIEACYYVEASQRLREETGSIIDALRRPLAVAFHGASSAPTTLNFLIAEPEPEQELESDVLVAEPHQHEFPLAGGFSPSRDLTMFWVRGVKAAAQNLEPQLTASDLAYTELDLQQQFAKMLTSLFGTIGQQLRHEANTNRAISKNARFEFTYQIQICDRFLVIPDEAQQFLSLLHSEIVVALRNGAQIRGAWGKIEIADDASLRYELTQPRMITDPTFVRAQEIE